MKNKTRILFRQHVLSTDIYPEAIGVAFETVWKHRVRDKFEGVSVFVEVSKI
jgi:hypothetical protein